MGGGGCGRSGYVGACAPGRWRLPRPNVLVIIVDTLRRAAVAHGRRQSVLAIQRGGSSRRPFAYGGWSNNRSDDRAYTADNGVANPRLFDLADDPGETETSARSVPDVVAERRAGGAAHRGLAAGLRRVICPRR